MPSIKVIGIRKIKTDIYQNIVLIRDRI